MNLGVFTTTPDVQPVHLLFIAVTPSAHKFKLVSIAPYLFQGMNVPPSVFHPPYIVWVLLYRELIFFPECLFRTSNCARIWQFLTWVDASIWNKYLFDLITIWIIVVFMSYDTPSIHLQVLFESATFSISFDLLVSISRLAGKMRASVLVWGSLVSAFNVVTLSLVYLA